MRSFGPFMDPFRWPRTSEAPPRVRCAGSPPMRLNHATPDIAARSLLVAAVAALEQHRGNVMGAYVLMFRLRSRLEKMPSAAEADGAHCEWITPVSWQKCTRSGRSACTRPTDSRHAAGSLA
jgi:hypothetical protein